MSGGWKYFLVSLFCLSAFLQTILGTVKHLRCFAVLRIGSTLRIVCSDQLESSFQPTVCKHKIDCDLSCVCHLNHAFCRFSGILSYFLRFVNFSALCHFSHALSLFLRFDNFPTLCKFSRTFSLFPHFLTLPALCHFSRTLSLLPRFVTLPALCHFSRVLSLFPRFVTLPALCHSSRAFRWFHVFRCFTAITRIGDDR